MNPRALIADHVALMRSAEGIREKVGVLTYAMETLLARICRWRAEATVRLRGVHYKVRVHGGELSSYVGICEQGAYEGLPDFVARQNDVVLDVGANVGVYALRQAARGGLVYAFEPHPEVFRRLQENIRRNGLVDAVTAFRVALGARPALASLNSTKSTPMTRVDLDAPGEISVQTLDSFVADLDLKRVALLKIDVEGAEVEVLRGASKTLACTDRVVVEYHGTRALAETRSVVGGTGRFEEVLAIPRYLYFRAIDVAT